MITAKGWLEKAKRERFAIGAFNVGNLEVFKAVAKAAGSKRSPIIIESSPGETSFMGADNIVDLAKNFSEEYQIPILVNLDHAGSLKECLKGIEAGYDLIHFDGSKLPLSENVATAKKVVEKAHQKGLLVEGEIDHIIGSSELHSGSASKAIIGREMTDPEKAFCFIKETGVDTLAVFIGNVHGVYAEGGENLNLDLLQKIAEALDCNLSLHGGSGIPDDQVKEAIKRGIVKVNVNTEIRQVFKDNLQEALEENPQEYALYKIFPETVEAVQRLIEKKIEVFGSKDKI